MKKFSVSTMWDSRAIRPDNKSRVMLCVVLPNRSSFKLSLKIQCTKADYEKVMSGRSLNVYQQGLRKEISSFVLKGEELIERLAEPTKEIFLRFFKSDNNLSVSSKVDVYSLFQNKIDALNLEERFGTAENCRCAMKSFKRFKKELYLEDIDEQFINRYKAYNLSNKVSLTTIGIYLRNLRSIFNKAEDDGLVSGSKKPFKNIVIGSSVKSKSVLYPEQLKLLWNYRSDSIRDRRAIAMFFFCYLNNGMNFKDVGMLKYKNINGDILSFVREKTKRTKGSTSEIRVYLSDTSKKIIDEWGNPKQHPDNFIFQFVSKYTSPKHHEDTIIRYKRYANKSLKRIGNELGFKVSLCLNLARHSYATVQKISGTPVSFISDAMGHSSMAVTSHYLKQLPDANLKVLNQNLLSFIGNE